ncbi:FHA domain-containing protein [uncultured Nocardioides sp.]|uniref:FHA domain-containing protein n=1 Tax=uncultured Nocardioides sp. TaxID=198441 RepID=UPI0025FDADE0|nr:hypothetical protein [uncultured Nocardioides sp.]
MSNAVRETEAGRRRYLPGSWYAAIGPGVTVLLPASAKARVAAVWEQVDDGATFDDVLDVLLASGLRGLPDVVVVGDAGDAGEGTRVIVRGRGRVSCDTADGAVEVTAEPGATWGERTVAGVTGLTAEVEPDAAGDELSVVSGLVRVSRVTWGGGAVVGAAAASSVAVPEPTTSMPEPEPEPVEVEAEGPEAAGTGEHPAVATAAPDEQETVAGLPPAAESDHDGHTTAGVSGHLPAEPPGIEGQPPAPSVTSRPVARLVFSSGDTIEVDRAILVGRAPEARRFASSDQPQLVTVPSPHHEISSTHLEVRPGSGVDHGMSVATDLGSTNGTMLMQPGLPPEELQPGIAVSLMPGAIIDLGDGVTIQVTHP